MSIANASPEVKSGWIGYSLKITQHRLRQRLEAELAGIGITAAQNAVLLAIAGDPRISNASLARAAFVTPQSMQGILVNLERDGLIRRSPHPVHGRIIMTELTDAGVKAGQAGVIAADTVERQMLAGFTADETATLGSLLRRCGEALDAADDV